jgi:CHAT domain-containing protein
VTKIQGAVRKYLRTFIWVYVSILFYIYANSAWSQQQSDFDKEKAAAYSAFGQGQIQESVKILKALIAKTPTPEAAADLQRDLVEVCVTGFFVECYNEANQALFSSIQSNKQLLRLFPEVMLYVLRETVWATNDTYIQQILDSGGPSTYANPQQFPATYAQMQLALHTYYIRKSDLKSAEEAKSSAIMGLLLSDPQQVYTTCKILVGLFDALISEQDIVGAFQFLEVVDPYISKRLSQQSVLYAQYLLDKATLFGYTNLNSVTEQLFAEASAHYEKLDISPDVRAFNLAVANSSASAVLAINNKLNEAKELHAKHPMHQRKEQIIVGGEFKTLTEFYFALSDVFLSALANDRADDRWKALFEKKPKWDLGGYDLAVIDAYRGFALGCIELTSGDRSKASSLLISAAKARIDTFESVQRVNFEGFQMPNFIDKIMLGVGLQAAAESRPPDAADLMLRSGEILFRNLRYSISDDAVLLASQPNDKTRENARSYINLVREKRDWEVRSIKQWLDAPGFINKGALIQEYTSVVTTLSKLKSQFVTGSTFRQANGLPTIAQIQNALLKDEIFITYFPTFGGFGRLCVAPSTTTYSFGVFDQTAQNHVRLLEFATTATFAPNANLDSQFPVPSAIYLSKLLFAGLDQCMKPGVTVTMSLPRDVTAIPIGALLNDPPPRLGNGYDLRQANWLIRQYSFSFVVSARQLLAVRTLKSGGVAPLDYLGAGAPHFDKANTAELRSAFSLRENIEVNVSDLTELPEAASELKAVARTFNPVKSNVLMGDRATEEAFRSKELDDYDVIHFATHGIFSADAKGLTESALILTPVSSSDAFDDGILSASEISRLSLRARLVVLSACNSAKYNQQQANLGVHDLQAAFTVAGTPTILATLWSVETNTSADLMTHFFENWRSQKGVGAAQALAQSIRSFLDRSDVAHQHPRFWAAFEIFGNGAVMGARTQREVPAPNPMKPLKEFGWGDIVASTQLDGNVIFSVQGQWDGKRMAGIVSSRDPSGHEKWRVTSREIAAGPITVSGDQIYALGMEGVEHFVPVIQSFDSVGHIRWVRKFSDLTDYAFSGPIRNGSGIFLVAYPEFIHSPFQNPAYLIRVNSSGEIAQKTSFLIDSSRPSITGARALTRILNDRVIVAVNRGSSLRTNPQLRNVLGWPPVCFEDAAVSLFEFNLNDLSLITSRTIRQFQAAAMEVWKNDLLVGGESLDNCAQKGNAAVLKVKRDGSTEQFWKDNNIFPSVVRGMAINNGVQIAVNFERAIAINVIKPVDVKSIVSDKRYLDDNMAIREASLIDLSPDGIVRARQDFSAGLSIILTSLTVLDGKSIVAGTLGGDPASTLQ